MIVESSRSKIGAAGGFLGKGGTLVCFIKVDLAGILGRTECLSGVGMKEGPGRSGFLGNGGLGTTVASWGGNFGGRTNGGASTGVIGSTT